VVQSEEEKRVVFCQEACMQIRDTGSSNITADFECLPHVDVI
jgi:hypothetical protein